MASGDLRKELECSICLSFYADPVSLQCGHNYCRECINHVWDAQEQSGGYSCPECRAKIESRTSMNRNIKLRNILDNLSSTQLDEDEPGILCTYCIHFPVPAVKTCLLCESYLCDNHLMVHSKSPEHVISDPATSLENRKCPHHKKILEYYCTEDDACVCVYCLVGEHVGHEKESLDEASKKRKKKMTNVLSTLTSRKEETKKRIQSLQERQRNVEENAAEDTKRITALCREFRTRLEDLEKRVLSEISRQAEQVSRSVSDMIQQLEIKVDELSRKMCHVVDLCNITDPLTVLLGPNTSDLCDSEDGDNEDRERHDKLLHDGDLDVAGISHTLHTLSDMITGLKVCFHTETPADILLDVNTAGNNLDISHDSKTASWSSYYKHPETPERFQCSQVISRQNFFSGRHCWDVDVGASSSWRIGMCYPSIQRSSWPQLLIGYNSKSWCLQRSDNGNRYAVTHGSKEIQLPAYPSSNRVRVRVDYEAGQLSFHDLCDPIRHLHTFTATFTEPLHAVLWVGSGYIKLLGGAKS